jgi:hypothetical protein
MLLWHSNRHNSRHRRSHHHIHNQQHKRTMICHSDYYKEDKPMDWPSLSRETMPNMAWKSLRQNRKAQ